MYGIGALQGRLSKSEDGRLQFFPRDWKKEYAEAKRLGFVGLEWLIDPKGWEENPVFTDDFASIAVEATEAGCPILSIAADWFMEVCLWEGDIASHRAMLMRAVEAAAHSTNKLVLVPLLEKHAILDGSVRQSAVRALRPLAPDLDRTGVRVAFETELDAATSLEFLDALGSEQFGVYYDTGNCTSYGFDCQRDIRTLTGRIHGVHLKDRKKGTTQTVCFGSGDTDFEGIFRALHEIGWRGNPIMQAWRGEQYLDDAAMQLAYIEDIQKRIQV